MFHPFPADYSIGGHAKFYREVTSILGLDRVLVFGHSYSGTVATTFAANYPEITLGCLLVAPPVVGTDIDEAEGGDIRTAMNAAMARHQNQPWYEDAVEAEFNPDMADIEASFRRGLPLYFSDPTDDVLNRALDARQQVLDISEYQLRGLAAQAQGRMHSPSPN